MRPAARRGRIRCRPINAKCGVEERQGSTMSRIERSMWTKGTVRLVLALSVATAFVLARPLSGQEPASRPEFHVTLAGDAIINTAPEARESVPGFMGVVNALRKGDASALNFEGTFATSPEAYPVFDSGGTWIFSDPARLKGLQWMGFNMFSAANNHSVDLGVPGLLDTVKEFKKGGAVFAGIGENLAQARAAAYLQTAKGRVGFISRASTFSASAPAGQARQDMRGRPGLAPLRFLTTYRVDAPTFESLKRMRQDLKIGGGGEGGAAGPESKLVMSLTGGRYGASAVTFERSDKPGIVTTAHPDDLKDYTARIRDAKQMAHYVVTYSHMHEAAPEGNTVPAQFITEYARAAVDAGVDVWAASGPHVLRGIEIYKGKVIMYSLGNFIFENDLVIPQPQDNFDNYELGVEALPADFFNARTDFDRKTWPANPLMWEAVVADVTFRGGRPAMVTLTPITLGFGNKRTDRGYPQLANLTAANKILQDLQKLSKPYGTTIVIKDGIGTITINPGTTTSQAGR
ncbi:MAG: hypothetical protein EXQ50_15300 [Acidobacteria bacterium]|nr:hypothetical protein [Acidobacteriota bacterium]